MIETLISLAERGNVFPPKLEKRDGGVPISNITPGSAVFDSLTLGLPTYTGRTVNPQTAMTYSAVYSAVYRISSGIAKLPLLTYRNVTPDGLTKRLATEDYRYRLLREQPNDEMTSFQWREAMMASLLLWGNSYSFLDWDSRGHLRAIWPLRPDAVMLLRNSNGRRVYYYQAMWPYSIPVKPGWYEDWQILHIPGLGFDGTIGYSPIAMARQAIALGMALEEYAGRFFANNAKPPIVLTSPAKPSDVGQLREAWNAIHGGLDNVAKPAVLYGGMDIKELSINPRDAQFLEGRNFQIGDVARIYNLDPYFLGDPNGKASTYASTEQADIQLAKHTLAPWGKRIEETLNITVLSSQDALTCKHDMTEMLRGDTKSQAESLGALVSNGIYTRDEARAILDRNPIGGNAGKLTVQSQNIPIDDAGKQPAPVPVPPQK